jgi:hypothetical protein
MINIQCTNLNQCIISIRASGKQSKSSASVDSDDDVHVPPSIAKNKQSNNSRSASFQTPAPAGSAQQMKKKQKTSGSPVLAAPSEQPRCDICKNTKVDKEGSICSACTAVCDDNKLENQRALLERDIRARTIKKSRCTAFLNISCI